MPATAKSASKLIGSVVHTTGIVDLLKELFARRKEKASSTPIVLSSTDIAEQAFAVRQLIDRLDHDGEPSIVAGCVQILGLDEIRARLGTDWSDLADQILEIAQEALQTHLGPGDVYRLINPVTFQICFESSDQALAGRQVEHISAIIEERIAADLAEMKDDLSVETFVASIAGAKVRDESDPLSALYTSLIEIRDAVNGRAIRRHSLPALRNAGALFQPMWSSRGFGHTMNRCLLDNFAGNAAVKHLDEIAHIEDLVEALANLDSVVFAKSIEGLHRALGEASHTTIIVPVHFQTLALRQPDFLEIAGTLPLPYRRSVILDLIGVPTATSTRELTQALKTGRTVTDRIIVQMSPGDHRMNQNMRNLIWGLSMNLGEVDSDDPHIVQELQRFARTSTEHGLCSFAYGANTIGKAGAIVEAGFDYVAGAAVGSTLPLPRPHSRFTPLFGDAAPRIVGRESKPGLREHPRFAPVDPNSTVTLLSGEGYDCRIPNASASGAVVICDAQARVGDYVVIGSIPARVVRTTRSGFAVRFLEVQKPSAVEMALKTRRLGDNLLASLRALQAKDLAQGRV